MSEYWVSKKQYWCKYCNIWVRDDAPSKRLHESGLKHQGSKERFIRDLYKGGERAKRDKESEARQIERIEAAARASHSSKDGGAYGGRPMQARAPAPTKKRDTGPTDKWSNYSTASQLGLTSEDTPSSYEIEQMVRGRGTSVGQWEEVKETPTPPPGASAGQGFASPVPVSVRAEETEEQEAENFKFQTRDKRPIRDVYDDDDFDPRAVLGSIKLKSKERKVGETESAKKDEAAGVKEEVKAEVKEEVKEEIKEATKAEGTAGFRSTAWGTAAPDVKAEVKDEPNMKKFKLDVKTGSSTNLDARPDLETEPDLAASASQPAAATETAPPAGASMFKKRRPPPSSRKK